MTSSPTPKTPTTTRTRVLHGQHVGVVISDKRDKSRTVAVTYQVRHPKYGKYLHRRTKYQVHDGKNESKVGDKVEIVNCRPISKTKNWRLVRVISSAQTQLEHVTEVKTS